MYENFIGKTVSVKESTFEYKGKNYPKYELDENDPVINEIKSQAGDRLRIFLPGMAGDCRYDTSRLNVRIEKNAEGSYEIMSVHFG
jgi:hypothetical protein